MLDIPITVNFERLMTIPDGIDIISLEGSTRSSKTISIEQFLVQEMLKKPGTVVRCYREDGTTHEETTIEDFRFVMKQFGRRHYGLHQGWEIDEETGLPVPVPLDPEDEIKAARFWDEQGKWNIQKKRYTFNNGSFIKFEETKNIKQKHGRKADISWFNEVMEVSIEAWDQIEPRTTGLKILDFNPSFNHHWVFDKIHTLPNCLCYHSTYKDNPFLTPIQIYAIEKHDPTQPINVAQGTADPWWWDVYGLGKRGRVEGVVFKMWEIVPNKHWPKANACRRHGYGLDFGYHPDPAALVEACLYNSSIFCREIFYEQELQIVPNQSRPDVPNIHQRLIENGISKDARIYADNSRNDSIAALALMGWNVIPCKKPEIIHGIKLLQGFKKFVPRYSIHLQTELEHYTWDKKVVRGETTWLQKPIDGWNHLLDPLRYWAVDELQHEMQRIGAGGRNRGGQAKTKRR